MKKNWTRDAQEAAQLIAKFVDTGLPVSLQLNSNWVLRSKVLRIHHYKNRAYLLLQRPAALESSRHVRAVLFKMSGFPILGFSSPVERESENVLAFPLPIQLFQLELRKDARATPLQGSMATFFIRDRARVSICNMENVSMGGVKLSGRPAHQLQTNDVIGPCTLSLAGRDALISREVTVNNSFVTRVEELNGGKKGLGIEFDLSGKEKRELHEHIEFISKM